MISLFWQLNSGLQTTKMEEVVSLAISRDEESMGKVIGGNKERLERMKSPRKQELGGKRKSEISLREEQLRKEFKELIETLNLENTEKALLLDEYDENLRSHKEEAEVEGKEKRRKQEEVLDTGTVIGAPGTCAPGTGARTGDTGAGRGAGIESGVVGTGPKASGGKRGKVEAGFGVNAGGGGGTGTGAPPVTKDNAQAFHLPQLNAAQRMQLMSQVKKYLQFRRIYKSQIENYCFSLKMLVYRILARGDSTPAVALKAATARFS